MSPEVNTHSEIVLDPVNKPGRMRRLLGRFGIGESVYSEWSDGPAIWLTPRVDSHGMIPEELWGPPLTLEQAQGVLDTMRGIEELRELKEQESGQTAEI